MLNVPTKCQALKIVWVTAVSVGIWGCSSPTDTSTDAGENADRGQVNIDACQVGGLCGATADTGDDAADGTDDRGQVNMDACSVDRTCGEPAVARAEFGVSTVTFDRAYFGLSSPEQSESGEWELHVEAYRGGDEGCPTESSATPSQTLIVTRVPLEVGRVFTREAGIAVSVLDYEGTLIEDDVVAAALTTEVELISSDVCADCAAPTEESAVLLDVSAQFEGGGTVQGRVEATHCASMDI